MNLQEKISDFKMLIKNDRRILIGGGFIIVVLIVTLFTNNNKSNNNSARLHNQSNMPFAQQIDKDQNAAYEDLVTIFRDKLEEMEARSMRLQEEYARLRGDIDRKQGESEGVFEKLVTQMENIAADVDQIRNENEQIRENTLNSGYHTSTGGGDSSFGITESLGGLDTFGMEDATVAPPPKPPKKPIKVAFISPGDAVQVQLLTGVNAPVDGTPYPVVFKILGPVKGPDGATLELGEARIIAAAQGSQIDSRVLFRMSNMAMRYPDGRRVVLNIDGWVVGEDGIRGMKGRVIDKLGSFIAATATTSFTSALLQASLNDNVNNVNVNNSTAIDISSTGVEKSSASAINDATRRLLDVLIDRFEKLVPVVEILSGRDAVAIFSSPVEVYECGEECDNGFFYSSLD